MTNPHDDRMGRPDGHHYDAPESDEDRAGRSWVYFVLGAFVLVLLVLIATGTVEVLPY